MFAQICTQIRESIYGITGVTQISKGMVNYSNGTAFMISPGYLVTTSHGIHIEGNPQKPVHKHIDVIRAPDVGQSMEDVKLIAEDTYRDVALLKIDNPRSDAHVTLVRDKVRIGTPCGSLGFPLAEVEFIGGNKHYHLTERFQGASISAHRREVNPPKPDLHYCETDSLMYGGSSGCPGFLVEGDVWGMQTKSLIEGLKPKIVKGKKGKEARPNPTIPGPRMAISLWVPSSEIIGFVRKYGINV
jgi:hypothetical protein